jgi:hypothetical protein
MTRSYTADAPCTAQKTVALRRIGRGKGRRGKGTEGDGRRRGAGGAHNPNTLAADDTDQKRMEMTACPAGEKIAELQHG